MPCNIFEYAGFKDIANPIQESLGITIFLSNVHHYLKKSCEEERKIIKNEVANRIICLKMDTATKYDRSILGVNIKFLNDSKIILRTLANDHDGID